MMQRLMEIPQLAALMQGASQTAELAATIASHLIDVGLAEPMPHEHVRVHPALCPYLSAELPADQRPAAESAWSEAMFLLTSHLYGNKDKDAQTVAELTLLELPNLLAALEHRFQTAISSDDAADAREGEAPAEPQAPPQTARQEPRPPNPSSSEQQATALESVIGMATGIEGLLQHLGRPQAMAVAESIRSQSATRLKELRGVDAWSHFQFEAERAVIERLLESGRFGEAVRSAEQLLDRCRQAGESAYSGAAYDLAMAHMTLGRALKKAGSAVSALEPLIEARTRFEQLASSGDEDAARMASVSLRDYADCLGNLRRLDEAAEAYEQTIQEAESRDDARMVATNKGQLGTVRLLQRRYAEALAAWDEARQTFEQLDEPGSVAAAWHQIGAVHGATGQYESAEHAYQQSLHIESNRGHRAGEADTLNQLGNLYSLQARREEAVRFYRQAADIYAAPDIQDLAKEGLARSNAAGELIKLSRYDDARHEILRAIECKEPYGHAAEPWKTFGILSDLEQAMGDADRAAAARTRAVEAYLSYRRDGGENHTPGGQLARIVTEALAAGDTTEAAAQLVELTGHAGYPRSQPIVEALTEILGGSRDAALATDPRLGYDDAAELQLLLERLG
jgi:tetratricopeptide (TPR) repeat protein